MLSSDRGNLIEARILVSSQLQEHVSPCSFWPEIASFYGLNLQLFHEIQLWKQVNTSFFIRLQEEQP